MLLKQMPAAATVAPDQAGEHRIQLVLIYFINTPCVTYQRGIMCLQKLATVCEIAYQSVCLSLCFSQRKCNLLPVTSLYHT